MSCVLWIILLVSFVKRGIKRLRNRSWGSLPPPYIVCRSRVIEKSYPDRFTDQFPNQLQCNLGIYQGICMSIPCTSRWRLSHICQAPSSRPSPSYIQKVICILHDDPQESYHRQQARVPQDQATTMLMAFLFQPSALASSLGKVSRVMPSQVSLFLALQGDRDGLNGYL